MRFFRNPFVIVMSNDLLFLSPAPFMIGSCRIDPGARRVTRDNTETVLRPKAMSLLAALASVAPEPLSRHQILDVVWPDVTVGDDSVTQVVRELRRAFGQRGRLGGPLQTLQKGGYRLIHPVDPVVPRVAPAVRQRGSGAKPGAALVDAQLACAEARRLRERNGVNALQMALDLCREAVAMAPDYAPALAEYAVSLADCALFSPGHAQDLHQGAEMASRAIFQRPDLACGYLAQGVVCDAMGATDCGMAAFAKALDRAPSDPGVHYLLARLCYAAGDFPRAARAATEAARLRPDDYCAPYLAAGALAAVGDTAQSAAVARMALNRLRQRLAADGQEPRANNIVGALLARAGQANAALADVAAYERAGGQITYYNAAAYAWLGEVDIALHRLQENIDTGYRNFRWIRHDPSLNSLRGMPAFERIAAHAN
jgi:DNA-binding winged helix-turn-helix (wHTH) protein/tetratricopeptide (TPR) repeat protein